MLLTGVSSIQRPLDPLYRCQLSSWSAPPASDGALIGAHTRYISQTPMDHDADAGLGIIARREGGDEEVSTG